MSIVFFARRPAERKASSLWRDRDFVRLWIGQTCSQFGAQAGQITLPLVALIALHGDSRLVGELRAVGQAPVLVLSLFVGAWVDQRRARPILVAADTVRALALAAVPTSYALHRLGVPTLLMVALAVGVATVFFDVAYQTLLVRLVPRRHLAAGVAALEGSRSAAQMGGPALGSGPISAVAAPLVVLGSVACFLGSAASLRRIQRSEPLDSTSSGAGVAGMIRLIGSGLRLVFGHSQLRAVGLASAIFQLAFAAYLTCYLVYLPRVVHLSGAALAVVLAAFGPGALVGSLLSARLPRWCGYGPLLVAAAALADGLVLIVPAMHGHGAFTVTALVAINLGFGLFGQTVDVATMAVRQALTPVAAQGRVTATLNVIGLGMAPLGSLLGGWLATRHGVRVGLVVGAAALFGSPLCILTSPLARLGRALPAAPD